MRTKLVIAGVMTAAAVSAVGASAYTTAIGSTPTNKVVGYASTTIDGATMATPPVFHFSTGNDEIIGIDVVLTGDTTGSKLYLNQNGVNAVVCSDTSGHGVYDAATTHNTLYACTGLTYLVNGTTSIGYALQ